MVSSSEEARFERHRPEITEPMIVKLAQDESTGGEIISLNGRGVALSLFALLMTDGYELHGPFVLNRVSAQALCKLLIAAGFRPQAA